ncbi:uncharacterized protein LOC127289420 [Leptopilina boulardi]|uniref:uncharacterized protein LOC127277383 n=1 Tax=Leptopilina boulardi TaxID=63433 RepID=UPI0021F5E09D|nr:uncharacterized protein LOC127277383 [Leptopilina boulardi]XP_051159198.1 uncharacterized protein LOC127280327 [Leptopilina boulardi]XP_051173309.1 uncharacterized protein LOC127289420 [Leptopilina boulardi]
MAENKVFKIVEFIEYSTSDKRSVDVVYATHIRYDSVRGLLAKFMDGPSYTKEDSQLIREIVKNKVSAPEDWPEFKVKIIVETETYEEALMKLQDLDKKNYCCTTDSEEVLTPVKKVSKNFNEETHTDEEEDIDQLFDVPGLNEDLIKNPSDLNASTEVGETSACISIINEKQDGSKKRKQNFNESSSVANKKFKDSNNINEKMNIIFDKIQKIGEDVEYMKGELKELKKKNVQYALCQETMSENLASKFEVNLPLQTMEEFEKLEGLLPTNKELQHSLKSALLYNVDLRADLKKILRQILSSLFSREVAMKFTASKPMPEKKILNKTNCCNLIEGLIPFKSMATKEKYSKPEIIGAMGYVLTRSYDWGNGRTERRKKKDNNDINV